MKKILFSVILLFNLFPLKSQIPYQVYFGNLHSHTSNSDGSGSPTDAFNYARNTAGLDFLAVTDHLEQIDVLEWYNVKNDANSATVNGTYIGIAGWEWGSPLHGHVNVFNTSSIITDVGNLWYTTDLPAFISWVLDHSPAFAQFNHPGEESYFTNWNDFEYIDSITDNAFPLIEVQNVQQATDYYEYALNKGWHLSPVWNQDNHSPDWGTKNDGRAGIWAVSLARTDLFDAIMAGRTFATMDKNASIWLDINGTHMGQTIQRFTNMPFHIKLHDDENEGWQKIELVSNNGVVDTFSAAGNLDTIISLSLYTENYLFLRAIQSDSDYIWSAPIYFAGVITSTENVKDINFSIYPNPSQGKLNINPEYNSDFFIDVFNIAGLNVYHAYNEKTLYLSHLENGTYILRIAQGDRIITKRIILLK